MRRGTSAWREHFWGPGCNRSQLVTINWMPGIRLTVDRRCEAAFTEMARIIKAHGYQVRPGVTGSYNCRKVTGGRYLSSHAFGVAVDINADTNPYLSGPNRRLVTDMPPAMVRDILAIRTRSGAQVFRWGGDWDGRPDTDHSNYDAMHFEVIATPEEMATGVGGPVEFDIHDPRTWPILKTGSRGSAVAFLQRWLGLQDDGIFGPNTETALLRYQSIQGLTMDGIVGPATWTHIRHGIAPLKDRKGEPPPHKGMTGGLD